MRPAAVKALRARSAAGRGARGHGSAALAQADWQKAEKSFDAPSSSTQVSPRPIPTIRSRRFYRWESWTRRSGSYGRRCETIRCHWMCSGELATVQFIAGRYAEAIDSLERVRAVDPNFPFVEICSSRER